MYRERLLCARLCSKYFTKTSSSNLCGRKKSKQKDQTERESRTKKNQGRLEGKLRDGGYMSVIYRSTGTHTDLYLYYLFVCPLWSGPGYVKSDLAQWLSLSLLNPKVVQLPLYQYQWVVCFEHLHSEFIPSLTHLKKSSIYGASGER